MVPFRFDRDINCKVTRREIFHLTINRQILVGRYKALFNTSRDKKQLYLILLIDQTLKLLTTVRCKNMPRICQNSHIFTYPRQKSHIWSRLPARSHISGLVDTRTSQNTYLTKRPLLMIFSCVMLIYHCQKIYL